MEKKIKVLLIAYNNLGKGGIQNQLIGIIRALKDKVDFDIAIWDNKRNYYRDELENNLNIDIIECFRNNGKTLLRQKADAFIRYSDIKRIMKEVIKTYGPYDVIHCNNAYDAAPCLEAAYESGIKIRIAHAHNMENPNLKKKITYPAYRLLYFRQRNVIKKYATNMIGCSKQVTDYFFGKGVGDVVHIGIDLSKLYSCEPKSRFKECIELLHVGTMNEQKNQLFLIDIIEQLSVLRKDIHLTLIGGGTDYLDHVKKKIHDKHLYDYVKILPPETDVPQAMANADMFVFPSAFEGFGIVLIEAQALGLKCFVSDVVSKEADCGGLVYISLAKSAKYWAMVLNRYIESSPKSDDRYDVEEFSVESMAGKMYGLYSRSI